MDSESQRMFSREYRMGEIGRANVFKALDKQRSESQLCDVVLVAEGRKFPAHRNVLAATSPYFRSMFDANSFAEGRSSSCEVTVHCVEPSALEAILDMIYTGSLRLNTDNMEAVLAAADHFLLEDTSKICVDYMRSILRSGPDMAAAHVIQIRRSARLYSIEELKQESDKMINRNMRRVMESPSFSELELEELLEILSSDDVRDPDEILFWRHAIRWIEFDPANRQQHQDKVMEQIRFPLMESDILVEQVLAHPVMNRTDYCKQLVFEAMKYQLLSTEQFHRQSLRTKPRYSHSSCVIYCLSGDKHFLCYLPAPHNRWYPLQAPEPCNPAMPGNLQYNILPVNGVVYALGTVQHAEEAGNFQTECLQRYSLKTNMWTRCAIPQHENYVPTLIECDKKLLAAFRDLVMEYDQKADTWFTVSECSVGPFDLIVSNTDYSLDFYNLGDGLCHHVRLNKRQRGLRAKNQIMTPSLFLTDILDVAKLSHHEVLISMRTSSGITRKIFNIRSEMWSDGHFYQGTVSRGDAKPRTNYPQALSINDPWICLCDRPYCALFALGTRTGLSEPRRRTSQGNTSGLKDGVFPFFCYDLEMQTWQRLAGFPERFMSHYMKLCIDDGQSSMAVCESRVWPIFE